MTSPLYAGDDATAPPHYLSPTSPRSQLERVVRSGKQSNKTSLDSQRLVKALEEKGSCLRGNESKRREGKESFSFTE